MSMCLYITSGRELDLMRLLRDQDAMARLTMGSIVGRMKSMGAFRDGEAAAAAAAASFSEENLDSQFKEMQREAWRQGIFQGLYVQLAKGQMREDLRQSRAMLQSFQAQLAGTQPEAGAEEGSYIDLHKSWHVMHYLFTGTAWGGSAPANTLLKGGRNVGEDLGYGPARMVDAKTTRAFAEFLDGLSADSLKSRIDVKKMAKLEIYCAEDEEDDAAEAELFDDIDHYFPMLKDYVAGAAARSEALAIWMT
jgi:hypothetical protein